MSTGEPYEYTRLLREKIEREKAVDAKYKEDSKKRLTDILASKMKTIMIGALAAFEEQFGFLWSHDDRGKPLTKEEQELKDRFNEARKQILDLGNTQIRNAKTEIEMYEVEWQRYKLTLPVIPEGPKGGNDV